MNATTLLANLGIMAGSFAGRRRWILSSQHVERIQRNILLSILKRNAGTGFGNAHRFEEIRSVRDFQRMVPLGNYANHASYIERMAAGERNVLVAEPVLRFELSSGSTNASKLIPYTASLKSEFRQGLDPWLYSLYASHPALLTGKQYWSVTPIGQKPSRTSGGIPIGFDEDAEYFGPFQRTLIRSLMAVPSAVSRISDIEIFRYVTMRFLLQCRDLAFVSVWNPTFLMLLLDTAAARMDGLMADIAHGTLTVDLDPELWSELGKFNADPVRAKEISAAVRANRGNARWQAIWPRLSLISCWADAAARSHAAQLQELFPSVAIQPKGLLATEGFITLPVLPDGNAALSVASHFFEFEKMAHSAKTSSLRLAHELELGCRYSVIMTTSGGLYRYQLDDVVEVTGFIGHRCPTLRFVGKAGHISDLFGEKLNECHVAQLFQTTFGRFGIHPAFSMLAPEEQEEGPAHYTLFLQSNGPKENGALRTLVEELESGLQENYHYKYCRRLGQLAPLQICLISWHCNAAELYMKTCLSLGQRLGNVKPAALHTYRGWRGVFPKRYP